MGGTFDPIHHGQPVRRGEVGHVFSLDEVVFVPTGQPGQKDGRGGVGPEDRYHDGDRTRRNPRFMR